MKTFKDKAASINFSPALPAAGDKLEPQIAERPRLPRTGVGLHADSLYRDRALEADNERLKAALKDHDGALPTRLLDPADIVLSKFANRHPDSYTDREFIALREDIRAAGGNKQPIGVRPLPGSSGKYELSFGSRRRQACLDEGLPVLALIEEMDDEGLFERMERENRARKNLRPYEQGMMYLKALDAKLYPSAKKMAAELQIDLGGLGRLLSSAKLPNAVLDACPSPLDIQYAWGPVLSDALQKNPEAVLARAAELKSISPKPGAKSVVDQLVDAGGTQATQASQVLITGSANQQAKLSFGARGRVTIVISNVSLDRRAKLESLLHEFLK